MKPIENRIVIKGGPILTRSWIDNFLDWGIVELSTQNRPTQTPRQFPQKIFSSEKISPQIKNIVPLSYGPFCLMATKTNKVVKIKKSTRKRTPSLKDNSEESEMDLIVKKLTVKQDKFCTAFVETGNASEAYRQVYSTKNMKNLTIRVNAYQLLNLNHISTTISELKRGHFERHDITVDLLAHRYNKAFHGADRDGNWSVVVASTTALGKLFGLIVEKLHHDIAPVDTEFTMELVSPLNTREQILEATQRLEEREAQEKIIEGSANPGL